MSVVYHNKADNNLVSNNLVYKFITKMNTGTLPQRGDRLLQYMVYFKIKQQNQEILWII